MSHVASPPVESLASPWLLATTPPAQPLEMAQVLVQSQCRGEPTSYAYTVSIPLHTFHFTIHVSSVVTHDIFVTDLCFYFLRIFLFLL